MIGACKTVGKRMEERYLNINICVPEDGEPEDLVERYYQEMVNTLFEGKAKIESDNNLSLIHI